jgi:hypothetical protein
MEWSFGLSLAFAALLANSSVASLVPRSGSIRSVKIQQASASCDARSLIIVFR